CVCAEVGLIQNQHWAGAAVPCEAQVSLDAARVEFAVERTHQKYDVDIRGDDLFFGSSASDFAGEFSFALQNAVDCCAIFSNAELQQHPIADRRKICARLDLVAQPSA